jgi:hypothetical protein
MKINSLAALPAALPEPPRLSPAITHQRQKSEVIMLPMATPPDEKKVMELNRLAADRPFCVLYKAKKYDTL